MKTEQEINEKLKYLIYERDNFKISNPEELYGFINALKWVLK